MDCMCCDGGVGPDTDHAEFLGSICSLNDGKAKFPAEPNRYALYTIAGCPFAARPWSVIGFYGLQDAIPIVKLFPASYDDGWFFSPVSEGEKDLVAGFPEADFDQKDPYHDGATHLKQVYKIADPNFEGAISVPLLWDTAMDTAVSNSSLGLAEMMATQMRSMATRNHDHDLFPCKTTQSELYQQHDALVKELHSKVTTVVYKINGILDGKQHDDLVDQYYTTLEKLQDRIEQNGGYLLPGGTLRFADLVLFISLVRLDLAYQWRFGLGRKSIRENYPILLEYKLKILDLPGIAETILPRDIMALYFCSLKWIQNRGRTLPQVPESWELKCTENGCRF